MLLQSENKSGQRVENLLCRAVWIDYRADPMPILPATRAVDRISDKRLNEPRLEGASHIGLVEKTG
jgi:hypothetical protein